MHSSDYSFSLDLAITSGTRRFSPLSGTLTLLYGTTFTTYFGCPCAPSDFGMLTGSLTPREPSEYRSQPKRVGLRVPPVTGLL